MAGNFVSVTFNPLYKGYRGFRGQKGTLKNLSPHSACIQYLNDLQRIKVKKVRTLTELPDLMLSNK